MFKYEVYRRYRYKLELEDLEQTSNGQIIAMGKGYYPDIEKDEDINWIAEKGHGGNDFAIYWISAKQPIMTTTHNGEKLLDMKMVQELLNCSEEVLERYRL